MRRTVELTRPRGSANCNLQKLHAKHAIAARVQRFVGLPLNDNLRLVSFERDLHAFVLIRVVFEVHCDAVLELEQDQSVAHDFAPSDVRIHNVVESRVWPSAFLPMSHELAVTKEVNRRLNGEADGAKRELEIELTDPHLGRELSDH